MADLLAFELSGQRERPLAVQAGSLDELTRQLPGGFYTTFRTLAGGQKVLGLRAHLDRLYLPAAAQGIRPAIPREGLKRVLARLAGRSAPGETRIRLILSASVSPGTVFALLEPFSSPPAGIYRDGVHTVTREIARGNPRLKSTAFIEASQAARQLVGRDVYEVLLVRNGRILEGMTSNFYTIQDGKLVTARRGILLGVTRRTVLRLARGEGLETIYRAPKLGDDFEEAFITSSSRGVVPVVSIDGRAVGQGSPGQVAHRLRVRYEAYVESHAERLV